MKRRTVALLAMVVMAVAMLAAAASAAFAQDGCVEEFPGAGSGACDQNPRNTEGSRSIHTTPPLGKFGSVARNPEANEHDTNHLTGRGKRV